MQQTLQCYRCGAPVLMADKFCISCASYLDWQSNHIPLHWLFDINYKFWLSIGNTKTAYEGYTALWCFDEVANFALFIVPRELIISVQTMGATFYPQSFPNSEIGLAFIQKITQESDNSFLIPIPYQSQQITSFIDSLFKNAFSLKNEADKLIRSVKSKGYDQYRYIFTSLWRQSIYPLSQLYIPIQELQRATYWDRKSLVECDGYVKGNFPTFWYTFPGTQFNVDFFFKYKMEFKALFNK